MPRGALLAAFFAGRSWWPHAAAQGPGRVFCLRCGGSAAADLKASACPGWSERMPAKGQAALLLGGCRRAGGSAADFQRLAAQRLAQLPAAPDQS